MNQSPGCLCRLYRPLGALLLLLAILLVRFGSANLRLPVAVVPTAVAPQAEATSAAPTAAPPTAAPTEAPTSAPPTTAPTEAPTSAPPTAAPTAEPTVPPTALPTVEPTVPAPTAVPIALPTLNLPSAADLTAEGLRLSGTGEPGATVEVWDGTLKVGTAVVSADGTWSVVSQLSEGAHKLAVITVDAAGNVLNELTAVEITVPAAIALPTLNPPAQADYTADGLRLSGTGQPGATVEVWDGTMRIGTAVVGADGTWSLLGKLSEGVHKLSVITVDAASNVLNEMPAVEITVPAAEAPPTTGDLTAAGQEYIVQWGDWLMKLARRFYGHSRLYTLIVEGTNAKAAVDSSFARIRDPNHIEMGQKLWIPEIPAGK